jgi:hypothetical protein
MIPTFFDLRTGKTAQGYDMSFFWWTEGNGACDCNRAIAFGVGVGSVSEELQTAHPGTCYGFKRFIAIDVEGYLEYDEDYNGNRTPHTKEQALIAMNSQYGT